MKISKLEGIKLLRELNIPTVELMDISKIIEGKTSIEKGISVRLSPKDRTAKWNVGLPSINRRTDINEVREFIKQYDGKYEVFAHETVKPEEVGTISKLIDKLVIETYKDYDSKHDEIISNRAMIPTWGDRLLISRMEILKKNQDDFKKFREVITYLKEIPFNEYEAEYVFQDGNVIFMDFTVADNRDYKISMESSLEDER